jgi:hypothetical protein
MPGFLLHQGATVTCLHAGQAQPVSPYPRVRVSGQPIVTQVATYMIAGCTLPSSGSPACVTAQWVTGAARVRAGGVPVLLRDSQAICAPTGTGVTVLVTQTRVRGA